MIIKLQNFLQNYKIWNDETFILEDKNYYYFWKKPWLASSWGEKKSILDLIKEWEVLENQKEIFSPEEEYWLLNRLDNDTSWFVYFAKSKEIKEKYKNLQKENQIDKTYYAVVSWKFSYDNTIVSYPIMHKNKSKMIAIKENKDIKKGRWKQLLVETKIKKIRYDKQLDLSYLEVHILKWVRHQIRVHLSSIWFPIFWDNLYWGKENDILCLFSVWIKI